MAGRTPGSPTSEPETETRWRGDEAVEEAIVASRERLIEERDEPASERVRESWDSLPGTEASVDYSDAEKADLEALEEMDVDKYAVDRHRHGSGVVAEVLKDSVATENGAGHKSSEVGTVDLVSDIRPLLQGYTPELAVELTITTPDGRRFSFAESVECAHGQTDEYVVAEMIDSIYGVAITRFTDGDDARNQSHL